MKSFNELALELYGKTLSMQQVADKMARAEALHQQKQKELQSLMQRVRQEYDDLFQQAKYHPENPCLKALKPEILTKKIEDMMEDERNVNNPPN